MSDTCGITNIDDNSSLYEILKNCATFQSYDSLPIEDFNDVCYSADYATLGSVYLENCPKMISNNQYSVSGNISNSSFASEDSLGDNILEENGRISLAYENLRTIPKRIAEKFAMQTKFLDLSYNNFQNLSFLSFFEDLHTLILDRNTKLDLNTLPFLQNLKILWINNCDIRNVANWIQRIRVQCPSLEYLSIMGNPGIKEPFNNSNLNMFNNLTNIDSMMLTTVNGRKCLLIQYLVLLIQYQVYHPGQKFYVADAGGCIEERFRTQKQLKYLWNFLPNDPVTIVIKTLSGLRTAMWYLYQETQTPQTVRS
ncbi:misexpression suppressor of KSR 4 isoform 2-T2 [Cochliomyia hominivorax]